MSAAAEHAGLDTELLAACEAFHATHAEMKDPRRGHTEADDEALAVVIERWYAELDAVVAIPARTAVGQRAKLRTVYIALDEAMRPEPVFGNREEFATLAVLRELLGDAAVPAPKSDAALGGTAAMKPPGGRGKAVTLSEVTGIADRFWTDLDALADRAEPDQRATVITLGIAAVGQRLCDGAQALLMAAVKVQAEHLEAAQPKPHP